MVQLVPEKYQTLDDYTIPTFKKNFLKQKLIRNLYKKVKKDLPELDKSLLEDDIEFILENRLLKINNLDNLALEYDMIPFDGRTISSLMSNLNIFDFAVEYYIFEEIFEIFPEVFSKKQSLKLEEFRDVFIKLEGMIKTIYYGKNMKSEFRKYKESMGYKTAILRNYSYELFKN